MSEALADVLRRLTGAGAAHGNREEFGARGAHPKGLQQYWTPPEIAELVRKVAETYFRDRLDRIPAVDLTAGAGHLLAFFPLAVGFEYDEAAVAAARTVAEARRADGLPGDTFRILHGDIRRLTPALRRAFSGTLPLLVLNPPFGLRWSFRFPDGVREITSAEYVLRLAWDLAAEDGGLVLALLPASVFDRGDDFARWLEPRWHARWFIRRPWETASVDAVLVALVRGRTPEPDRPTVRNVDPAYHDPKYEWNPPLPPVRFTRPAFQSKANLMVRYLERIAETAGTAPLRPRIELRDGRLHLVEVPPWWPARILDLDGRTPDDLARMPLRLDDLEAARRRGLEVPAEVRAAVSAACDRMEEELAPVMPLGRDVWAFAFAPRNSRLENLFRTPVTVTDSTGQTFTFDPDRTYVLSFVDRTDTVPLEPELGPGVVVRRAIERPVTYLAVREADASEDDAALFEFDRIPELARLFRPRAVRDVRSRPEYDRALKFVRSDPVCARIPLFDWQAEDVAAAVALPRRGRRCMFIADTGLGKSHMTTAAAVARLRMEGRRGGLIVFATKQDLIPPLEARIRSWGFPTVIIDTYDDVRRAADLIRRNRDEFVFAFVAHSTLARRSHTRRLPAIDLRGHHVIVLPDGTPEGTASGLRDLLRRAGFDVRDLRAEGPVPAAAPDRPTAWIASGGRGLARLYDPTRAATVAWLTPAEAATPERALAAWAARLVPGMDGEPQVGRDGVIRWPNGSLTLRAGRAAVVRTLKPEDAATPCCRRPFSALGRAACRRCRETRPEPFRPTTPSQDTANLLARLSAADGVDYFERPELLRRHHPETAAAVERMYGVRLEPTTPAEADRLWTWLRSLVPTRWTRSAPDWSWTEVTRYGRLRNARDFRTAWREDVRRTLDAAPAYGACSVRTDSVVAPLRRLRPHAVIIDEADFFISGTTERTSQIARLVQGVPVRYGATATLIPNWAYQAYFPLRIVYDGFLPWQRASDFNRLVQSYLIVSKTFLDTHDHREHRRLLPGDTNYGGWLRYVAPLLIRRTHTDVTRSVIVHDVPMSRSQKAAYMFWLESFARWFTEHVRPDMSETSVRLMQEILGRLLRLRQAASATPDAFRLPASPTPPPGPTPRAAAAVVACKLALDRNRRVILFSPFREEARRLADLLAARLGLEPDRQILCVTGDTEARRRGELILRANTDPDVRVLVTTTAAVDRGHDLQGFSFGILTGDDWRPGQILQLHGRMARIGQQHAVVPLLFLRTSGTVDAHILQMLNAKYRDIARLVDGQIENPRDIVDAFTSENSNLIAAIRRLLPDLQAVHRMAADIRTVPDDAASAVLDRMDEIQRLSDFDRLLGGDDP